MRSVKKRAPKHIDGEHQYYSALRRLEPVGCHSDMHDPTFPAYPYRHVRPSLLFEVEQWAVVCVTTEEYHREWSLRSGKHECGECDCDFSFHNGRQIINHVGCNFLQHVRCGSRIEVLGVCDGVDDAGQPCEEPSFFTGFIWGRHYFEKGWIPVRYLLPLDLIFKEEVIQARILRSRQVPGHVRLDYLRFSPHFYSPYIPSIRSEHVTSITISEELWETDSVGNFIKTD